MTDYTALAEGDDAYWRLADAAVRAGVGEKDPSDPKYWPYGIASGDGSDHTWHDPEAFIKDGRTVLALMELLLEKDQIAIGKEPDGTYWCDNITTFAETVTEDFHESLAVAIAEACLRALGELND